MSDGKTLLIVGRTANGKSSTANSLIGEKFFTTKKEDFSVKKKTVEIDGSNVTVVDGTDIGDTGSDMNGGLQDTIQKAETAVQLCESGFNALIFVMTYGTRFTQQEKAAVDLIKSLFGRDIFRRFGIIVMTRGDQFEEDPENDHKTFDQWCEEQTGDIRILFQECDYRIVIFNNRSTNNHTLERQRSELLKLVGETNKYSTGDFKLASSDRKKLLRDHDFKEADKQNHKFIQRIDQTLVRNESTKDGERRYEMLSDLLTELEERIKNIEGYFGGSEYSHLLLTPLETRVVNVNSKMQKLNQTRHETPIDKAAKRHLAETGYDKKTKRGKFFENKGENPVDEKIKGTTNTYDYFVDTKSQQELHSVVKDTVLLLVGRTGNGKSSTANSLIGEKFFVIQSYEQSVKKKTVEIDGLNVTVVDGIDIGDNGADMNGGLQNTIQKSETAVQLCDSGFNALIFVMTYGTRFTQQEKAAVDLIKSLFGRDIFRRFGIIVMTRGDQFERDSEDDPKTFDQWCKEQTGSIKDLFQECDNRIVIFDNRSSNTVARIRQRLKLLDIVPGTIKYSLQEFNMASNDRQKLLVGHSFVEADKQNKYFLQGIDQQLIRVTSTKETYQRHKMLTNILTDLQKQMETVQKTFEGSEYYNSLWTPLQTRLLNVKSQLKIIEGGRSEYTRVEEIIESRREEETNSQPYRSLPVPSRPLSNNILPSDNKSTTIAGAFNSQSPQTLPQEIHYVKDKVLLLVGRTGCGKSATANSIIGQRLFAKRGEDSNLLQKYGVDIEGSNVTVVDGTGIGDTGSDMNGNLQDTIKKAETAVQLCDSGFNALIFVMTYGTRFTKQEQDAVDLIKSLFGRDIFRRFGIIVMTRGDQFERDSEDDPKTFDQWCKEQTGSIKDLFQECDNRIVIFDNRSSNTETRIRQRLKLLNIVPGTIKYSLQEFNMASNDRQKLLVGHSFVEADKQNKYFLQGIDQQLISVTSNKETKQRHKMLTNILADLQKQMETVQKTFEGSEYYNSLWTPLQTRLLNVKSQLKIIEGDRIKYTRVEEFIKSHREEETNSQPYRRLHVPSRPLSNNILPSGNKYTTIDGAYHSQSPQTLPQEIHYVEDKVLLLVGRTGVGKSSTANSIIGQRSFAEKGEDSSLLQKYAVDIKGSKVTVVDGTGIGDTGSDMNGNLQDTIKKSETAVQLCESGFNALIFVMNYGTKFTKQEKDAVDLIRSLFGRDIFKRFGIIVMTRGDQFEMDTVDDHKTFDQWCEEQTGSIKDLFQECDNRIVIFNNRSSHTETIIWQRQKLLNSVPRNIKYSLQDFNMASNDRQKLLVGHSFLEADKQNKYFLQGIDQQLIRVTSTKETKQRHSMLTNILAVLQKQMETVQKTFEGSEYYNSLWTPLQTRLLNVKSQLKKIEDGRSEYTRVNEVIKNRKEEETNSQPYRSLPIPSRPLSNNILPSDNKSTTIDGAYHSQSPQTLPQEIHYVKDKVLLLVGRTGGGKSSTANSIIGQRSFAEKGEDSSLLQKYAVDIEGSKVTVVDGTGIGDTGSDMNGNLQDTIQKSETVVQLCESGFNALIFVMNYGTKFTKQEKDAVDLIRSLFGRDIFRRFGIIVMTRGDQFEMDTVDDHKTFDQWCEEQTGSIKDLFQECDNRIVIFNNRSSHTETIIWQRQKLLNIVPRNIKYSLQDFNMASNDRQKLLVGHSFLEADKQNNNFLQGIDQQLIRVTSTKETYQRYKMLTNILSDLHKQMETVQKTFEGSEYYNSLLTPLQTRLLNVKSKLKIIEGGRSEYTRVEEIPKSHREEETNSQSYRNLPRPSRPLSNNILQSDNKSTTIAGAYHSQSPQTLPQEIHYVKDKVLLLVGRTGGGKSSTANSIIGQRLFAKKGEDSSLLQKYAVDIEGSNVTVVDGTGIGDTGSDMNGNLQDTIQKSETAVKLCESGFNALIFVMTYGTRFTQQEKDAVDLIKSLFGRDIFRRFGIIVMTRGDQFERDSEDDPKTFDQWCKEQTGAIKDLFQECDNRIVIFDNRSSNPETRIRQRLKLLNIVPNTIKYSLQDFNMAINDRHKLLVGHSFLEADKQNKYFLQGIDQKLIRVTSTKETYQRHKMLTNILADLQKQMETVQKTFEGSEYYNSLWTPLQTRLLNVKSQLKKIEGGRSEYTRVEEVIKSRREEETDSQPYRSLPVPSQPLSNNILQSDNKSTPIDGAYHSQSPQTLPQETRYVKDKVLLLVGRTGVGKSSTANSIIGQRLFAKKGEDSSLLQKYAVDIEGSKVTVVDGTGIGDTGSDMNGDLQDTIQKAEAAVQLCESGFDALIFVMTYGTKFTKQEKDAVELIKSLFGRDIFKRFGIIVLTHGDEFEKVKEIDNIPFDQWCKSQIGDVKTLFEECQYRCVLFDNKTRDRQILSKQRERLLSFISYYNKYTLEDYQKQNRGLRDLILDTKFQESEKQNKKFVTTIEKRLKDINPEGDSENQKALLKEIELQLEKQITDIEREFKDSIYLQRLLTTLHVTQVNIVSRLRLLESVTGESKHYSSPTDDQSYIKNEQPKTVTTTQISLTLSQKGANDGGQQRSCQFRDVTTNMQEKHLEAQQVISDSRHDKVILLVGRTGNGKSSTAKSIVGERFFGTMKDDFGIKKRTVEIEGSKVTVVDGTDIGDSGTDMNGSLPDAIQNAENAVKLCESGFNALIFVMTYGTRFTKQEKDAVDLIKSLFGGDIFRRFGIIVMTRGDQFEMDTEDDHKTFAQWCEEQTGDIRSLFQECEYKKVLFNNRSPNKDTLDRQRQHLLNLVSGAKKYSIEDFKMASSDRQKLLITESFPKTEKENQSFLKDIDQQINRANSIKDDHSMRRQDILQKILIDLERQIKKIGTDYDGSDYASLLMTPLQTRLLNVKTMMRQQEESHRKGGGDLVVREEKLNDSRGCRPMPYPQHPINNPTDNERDRQKRPKNGVYRENYDTALPGTVFPEPSRTLKKVTGNEYKRGDGLLELNTDHLNQNSYDATKYVDTHRSQDRSGRENVKIYTIDSNQRENQFEQERRGPQTFKPRETGQILGPPKGRQTVITRQPGSGPSPTPKPTESRANDAPWVERACPCPVSR